MDSIVALDIETTGLDPDKDAIIEIGAVRFNGRRVEGEWTTLVNPGRPIPPFVVQLTGITDQIVREAPPIRAVMAGLKDFVGDATILGHSVHFDLGFLKRYGFLPLNDVIDTYDMASVLMPNAGRYNLSALGQALEVPLPATHRAQDDARATRAVYLRLYQMAMELPLPLLAEIVRLGEPLEWGGYTPLRAALRARARETISARQASQGFHGPLFETFGELPSAPLAPAQEPQALDNEEVASILEYGGPFSQHFPDYEYRPQQVEMLRVVTQALSEGHHLMVEAGTGTGKSMAYLIPAALFALQNNTRVVISTNTIALQDQLINKDIPDLKAALGLDVRAAVLKGRSNYLCPRRLENLRRKGPEDVDEMRVLAKVLVWLQTSQNGDRGEINLNGPNERDVWMRINAEDEGCTTENCIKRTGGACPFHRARLAAQTAHLLVVNHALLLADVATGSRVLPDYNYLIIDEAHHLEEATTNALSFHISQVDVEHMLRELGGPKSGMLGWTLTTLVDLLNPSDYAVVDHLVQRATDLAFQFDNLSRTFFETINQFLMDQREGRPLGSYAYQERILPATRTQPAWPEIEMAWEEAGLTLKPLLENVEMLLKNLANLTDVVPEESEDLYSSLSTLFRRLSELSENLNGLVFKPSNEKVYWAEVNPNSHRLSLHAAPLHIGPMMDQYLWREKTSVILTSATLTAAGEFDYLRSRLFAETADELALGSPFDFENSALLYMVNDIPEPGDRNGHQRSVESGLIQLAQATGGRMLVLFTSYDQLKRTSQAIGPVLAKHDMRVYEQGEGASANSLLESFRATERAVLLGTRAFWEGVDIPGEALSVLAIIKLPFDVPSDPIVAARSETFEDPFNQYSLPEAILRFRQGFGRLIRTQSDRGVVAIFDRRILSKRYGQAFRDSLPPCTVREGPLSALPRAAAQWLNII
jgi:DNA polymerase-3 subunit epsilon/ATP-dependent DNA helicase DinG